MNTWALAHLRVQEAERFAQEQRLINEALAAIKQSRGKNGHNFLSRIQTLKGLLLGYGESLYCRTLSLINSRSH